jgi:excisionase family DNA binding protein
MTARTESQRLLTTGEAADLLSVSRSTVSRRFDKGELRGEVNRITGERMIRRDSVAELMRERGIPVEAIERQETIERQIVVATTDETLTSRLGRIVEEDEALTLTPTTFGSDALIACASLSPDLLVLGDDLADISCVGIVSALERQMGKQRPRILCCSDDPDLAGQDVDVVKHLTRLSDTTLHKRICRLLGVAEQTPEDELPRRSERRWPRHGVSVPAKVGFYRTHAPRKHFWGTGQIENISNGGAYLSKIELESDVLPASPFRMVIQIDNPPLKNWQAHCQVLRLASNGVLSAGVRFLKVSKANQTKLTQLAG